MISFMIDALLKPNSMAYRCYHKELHIHSESANDTLSKCNNISLYKSHAELICSSKTLASHKKSKSKDKIHELINNESTHELNMQTKITLIYRHT